MVWFSRGEKPEGGLGRFGTLSVHCAVALHKQQLQTPLRKWCARV